jgi:ubiquinone/menaquinone biosynthesis C-methylase UbiE
MRYNFNRIFYKITNMIYNREYFFTECEGYKQFLSSKGLKLSRRLLKIYNRVIDIKPERVLDFGCGRGELALNIALSDIESYAIDISDDAIYLAKDIKNYWIKSNPQMKLNISKFNGKNFEFEDNFFDLVILSDIIEHLDNDEINKYLTEIKRILKQGGHIIIHTSPNKNFINYGLKLYWFIGRINGLKLDFDMRKGLPIGMSAMYHKNEQTGYSLKRHLKRAGFKNINIEFWKNPHYVYHFLKDDKYIRILNRIHKILRFKQLFCADLFATASKTQI